MKEDFEKLEKLILSPYAAKSCETKGRARSIEPCLLRTDYQRDRDRILHSKSFRRLKHKTQVFISPEGDHYRTRLTHTLEVAQIARTIARALYLNEDLVEAISLGHDLGHTPFGHTGERVLKSLTDGEFAHEKQSLRVVDVLENNGEGLNLTYEVRDGIVNHRLSGSASTLEGNVVRFADKIAYVNHDIEDAMDAGLLNKNSLPQVTMNVLGKTKSERISTLVWDVVNSSAEGTVSMSRDVFAALMETRAFLFEKVYSVAAATEDDLTARAIVENLYSKYMLSPESLPEFYFGLTESYPLQTVVCDYVAGMTDIYAMRISETYIKGYF